MGAEMSFIFEHDVLLLNKSDTVRNIFNSFVNSNYLHFIIEHWTGRLLITSTCQGFYSTVLLKNFLFVVMCGWAPWIWIIVPIP